MSETRLRPIWTPLDAQEVARAAAKHQAIPGVAVDYSIPAPPPKPFGTTITFKPVFGEPAVPGVIVDHDTDLRLGPLFVVNWRDNMGRPQQSRIPVDRVISVLEPTSTRGHRADVVIVDEPRADVEHQGDELARRVAGDVAFLRDAPTGRGRHRKPTSRIRRAVAVVGALAVVLTGGAVLAAKHADAAPLPSNCQQQPWLYGGLLGRMTTRTICDGLIRGDGTWLRHRNFYGPSYYKPLSCSTYGSRSYSSTSCSGGYQVPEFDTGVEEYVVTPDTVLPDEPGHLGDGTGVVA